MELKANELRYGNKLLFLGDVVTFKNITEIREDGIFWIKTFEPKIESKNFHFKPIPLTEEWLLKFGFDNWGKGKIYSTPDEEYDRFVLHNVLGGTSNFEVHNIVSTYGNTYYQQYIISCDEDERINWGEEIKYVHQLQNLYFALTNKELEIKM